jgi:two-component system cell cycle response regulator DivK
MDSLTADQVDRLRSGARRLLRQAASMEADSRHLLATSEAEHAGRATPGIEQARHLCVNTREHRLAAERLIADLGEEPPPGTLDSAARPQAVLVVDDYRDIRELLSLVLRDAGFVVRTAANGVEAVIAAYELRPAVIVMDVAMPVLDGIEATRLIKAIDELRDARVIAYTAGAPLADLVEGQKLDQLFSTVLSKPSSPHLVVAAVRRYATPA